MLYLKNSRYWGFPGSPVAKLCASTAGAWVWCLVGELRSPMLHGVPTNLKQQQEKIKQGEEIYLPDSSHLLYLIG